MTCNTILTFYLFNESFFIWVALYTALSFVIRLITGFFQK
ncbi:DUF2651 family protein [Metabacillus fastidiosus]